MQMQKLADAADGNAMLTEQVSTLREQITAETQASAAHEARCMTLSSELVQAKSTIEQHAHEHHVQTNNHAEVSEAMQKAQSETVAKMLRGTHATEKT